MEKKYKLVWITGDTVHGGISLHTYVEKVQQAITCMEIDESSQASGSSTYYISEV